MARTITISEVEVQRAKELRDKATTVSDFRAEILGASRRTVFRNRDDIRKRDDTKKKSWGGRRRCSMTIEQEEVEKQYSSASLRAVVYLFSKWVIR